MSVVTARRRAAAKPSLPKPHKPASEPKVPAGLCSTCNHARNCGYIRNTEQPVLFCEEFGCYVPPVAEELPVEVEAPTLQELEDWDKYKGLCVNCENREDCAIRNPETGVWHCEEYR